MKQKKEENIETFKEKLLIQRRKLITGAIIFFTIILIITGLYIYKLKMQSDAKELEAEAYRYYFGTIKDKNLSKEQRYIKAAQLFVEAYDKKKNFTYLLNAGYAYDMAGEKNKAIEVLNKVIESGDTIVANLAKVKIAMIHMRNNEQSEAIKKLNEILNGQSEVMKDFAFFQIGKIYEKDNKEEAFKYYENLIKNFPQSPFAELAKNYLKNK